MTYPLSHLSTSSTNIPPILILNIPVLEAELFSPWLHVQKKKKANGVYKREWQELREMGKSKVHIPFGSIFCLENTLFGFFFHLYIHPQRQKNIFLKRKRTSHLKRLVSETLLKLLAFIYPFLDVSKPFPLSEKLAQQKQSEGIKMIQYAIIPEIFC